MLSFFSSRPPPPAPSPPPPPHGGLQSFLKKAGVESGASLERVLATLDEQEVTSLDLLRSYWAEVAPLLKIVPRKRIETALGQVVPSGSAGTPRAAGTPPPLPPPPPPPPPPHSSPPALWPPMVWCHSLRPAVPQPEAPLLAVIGVTSHPERALIRQGVRASWMLSLPRDVHARFVLPGLQVEGAAAAALSAELAHNPPHEFALLNVSARLGWTDGARGLLALHWMHCAARAYPRTPYVGRACDSSWV